MAVVKEQIRQIISENNITSVADVYIILKESFKISCRNSCRQKWSARLQTRYYPWSKNSSPVPDPPSILLCLWTVSIIRYGKMAVSSAGQHM